MLINNNNWIVMAFNSDRGMIRITDAHKIISLIQSGNCFRKSSKEVIFDSTSFAPSIIPIRSIISDVLLRFPSQSIPYYTTLAYTLFPLHLVHADPFDWLSGYRLFS